MINEIGNKPNRPLKDKQAYKGYYTDKLMTLYNMSVRCEPIWRESLTFNLMILKVTLEDSNLILINVYRPTKKEEITDFIVSTIKHLDTNTRILVFGDMNYDRENIDKKFPLEKRGFEFIYDEDVEAFTRYQPTKNGVEKSYLDYYIAKNISNTALYIQKPIGKSDHMSLKLEIYDDNMKIMRQ
jgi:hypothetical protein